MKECSICHEKKDISSFYRNKNSPDQHQACCKLCFHTRKMQRHHQRMADDPLYREKYCKQRQQYRTKHADSIREKNRIYTTLRRKNDPVYRCKRNLSSKISTILNRNRNSSSDRTLSIIGCNLLYLKEHLASLFIQNMTWDNYGEWHIDHYVPISYFDMGDAVQVRICWNWRNLRPLWGHLNMVKNDSMPSDYLEHIAYIESCINIAP